MPARRRRIWSEEVPFAKLRAPALLDQLAARGVGLIVAVRPWDAGEVGAVLSAARDRGVSAALWPMLGDDEGRWANGQTMARYCAFVDALARAPGAGLIPEIAFDLEPPIAAVRALLDGPGGLGRLLAARRARGAEPPARGVLEGCLRSLESRGIARSAAVVPLVLADRGAGGYQRLLGTPVDGLGFGALSVMMYSSLLEGYSRGLLGRADARALLHHACRAARARHGDSAAVSLGVAAAGALGDERPYRSVRELAEDVAVARAAGVDDIAFFDLGGALSRPPLGLWLDALVETEAASAPPALTARAALGLGAVAACAAPLGWL